MSKKRKTVDEHECHTTQSRSEDRRLYCLCRQPDDPDHFMVQCGFCDEWYHPTCLGIDDDDISEEASWHCPSCIEVMSMNPMLTTKGLLGFQGRVAPSKGWNDTFPITDIDEQVIFNNVETKRHRNEGWTLFREGRVISLSSNSLNDRVYLQSQCQAAMRQKNYTIYTCFKDGGQKLKWSTCSCPAGIDGQCKHVVATLYFIIDMFRQGITKIPDIRTCTDRLQMWHVRKPLTDEPLLFSEISFVKHDPQRPVKRDLCCKVKFHDPIPECHKNLQQEDLEKLHKMFQSTGFDLPVLDTICANGYNPVLPKQLEDAILQDELFNFVKETTFDFNMESLNSAEEELYSNVVKVDIKQSQIIEKNTRLQSRSKFWFQQRQHRLTSSTFGTFCRMKPTTDPVLTFQQKKRIFTSKSVRHGINHESQAFAKYLEIKPSLSCPVGLVVNPKVPFLAVSPDRLVKRGDELFLVEIKCPYSLFQRKSKISDQLKEKSFYLTRENGETSLKPTHDYFYQIQGQLNITGVNSCDLVVFVPPDDTLILNIKKDSGFFHTEMLPKLRKVYFDRLLPHFVKELETEHI